MSRAGLVTTEPDPRLTGEQKFPEMPPEARRAFRVHQLHARCHAHVVARYPSLWTGEVIGATIAEQWMQLVMRRMQGQAQAEAARLVIGG